MNRQLRQAAQVSDTPCWRELELSAPRPSQSQPFKAQDALHVREQHFDRLAITSGL
jgi:hypothetical protein